MQLLPLLYCSFQHLHCMPLYHIANDKRGNSRHNSLFKAWIFSLRVFDNICIGRRMWKEIKARFPHEACPRSEAKQIPALPWQLATYYLSLFFFFFFLPSGTRFLRRLMPWKSFLNKKGTEKSKLHEVRCVQGTPENQTYYSW